MHGLDRLTQLFKRFPGIGPRQAARFVYFLLTQNKAYTDELIETLRNLRQDISQCTRCFRYFAMDDAERAHCSVCRDSARNSKLLMVVEKDVDVDAIERAHGYDGLYFVLGGALPILEPEPAKRIRSKELLKRLNQKDSPVSEIIFALSVNPEGEHTREYLEQLLEKEAPQVKHSSLGRGLSTGSELEYSDPETIKSALSNRK